MKKFINLSISEYTQEGYNLSVSSHPGDPNCSFGFPSVTVAEVEIDLAPHMEWIVEQGNIRADELKEQAQTTFTKETGKIKDFESKFLMIGVDK